MAARIARGQSPEFSNRNPRSNSRNRYKTLTIKGNLTRPGKSMTTPASFSLPNFCSSFLFAIPECCIPAMHANINNSSLSGKTIASAGSLNKKGQPSFRGEPLFLMRISVRYIIYSQRSTSDIGNESMLLMVCLPLLRRILPGPIKYIPRANIQIKRQSKRAFYSPDRISPEVLISASICNSLFILS